MAHPPNNSVLMPHKFTDKTGKTRHSALPNYPNQNSLYRNSHNPNWNDGVLRFELNRNYNTSDYRKRKWDNFITNHRENIRYITYYAGDMLMSNVRIVNGPVSENGRFYIYF